MKRLNLTELLSYAGNYKYFTYASWILSGLSSFLYILPFWFIWKIAGSVIFSLGLDIPRYGLMALGSAVLAMAVYITALMCSHRAAFRIAGNIRVKLLRHISLLPVGVAESIGTGHLRRLIIDTSGAAETYLAHQLPDKYGAVCTALGLVGLMLWTDWRLALVSLAPIALGFAVMAMMTGESMRRKIAEYQNALASMSNEAVGYIRGIPVVKTFGQSIYSFRRFRKSIEDYGNWTTAYTNQLRGPMMCYTLAVNGAFVFLVAYGLMKMRTGFGEAEIMNYVLAVIVSPLISVTLSRTMRQNENEMIAADALRRVNEVLGLAPLAVRDATAEGVGGSVELHDVSFSYGKGQALSGVNVSVKSGQVLALVGHSGGGKSTLAKLVARFFDVNGGSITVGGVDVKDYAPEDLMKRIALVFQDSRLIKGTILDNVRMSRPDASLEDVMNALESAQCTDITAKFPDSVNTVIGSEGVYLSGGEVQRLAVARALLKDAPVIVLDEATAYADPDNEARMQEALSRLTQDKTVIMIAHRLTAVKDADIIAVLEGGRITECGGFDDLIKRGGIFAEMWSEYTNSLSWKIKEAE